MKNSLHICIIFFERRLKDVQKTSLGEVHVMTFYGRAENVNFNAFYKMYFYNIFKV